MTVLRYADLQTALAEAIPEFTPELKEHLAFYDEFLPHVLFGDLTRFVISAWARSDEELVRKTLSFLDLAQREGDDMMRNVVQASFVENVDPSDAEMRTLISTWPASLRAESDRQRERKPDQT